MTTLGELASRPLRPDDAPALAALLAAQPEPYLRYFTPFRFDELTVAELLTRASHDLYMGLFWDGVLVAFFMLRGWDEGYAIPAYGVMVDHHYSGRGLGRLTLEMSKTICRLRDVQRLMLKVHPENLPAKRLYESVGFCQTGVDSKNGNLIYHFDFSR